MNNYCDIFEQKEKYYKTLKKNILNSSYYESIKNIIRNITVDNWMKIEELLTSEVVETFNWSFSEEKILSVVINSHTIILGKIPIVKFVGNELKYLFDYELFSRYINVACMYSIKSRYVPDTNAIRISNKFKIQNGHGGMIFDNNEYKQFWHFDVYSDMTYDEFINLSAEEFTNLNEEIINKSAYLIRNTVLTRYGFHCIDNEKRSKQIPNKIIFYDTLLDGSRSQKYTLHNSSISLFEETLQELRNKIGVSILDPIISKNGRNPKILYITEWESDIGGNKFSFGKYGFSVDEKKRMVQQNKQTNATYKQTIARYFLNSFEAEELETKIKSLYLSTDNISKNIGISNFSGKSKFKDFFGDGSTEIFDINDSSNLYKIQKTVIEYLKSKGHSHYLKNISMKFEW